jgi:hypothetical protein
MNFSCKGFSVTICSLLVVVAVSIGEAYPSDPSALLKPGKIFSGTISNINKSFEGGLPTTQEVTLRVNKISGNSAEVYVSWSKTSRDTGNAGSGTFTTEMIKKEEAIELSGQTGQHEWKITFNPDGTVSCSMNVPSNRVIRWGELK